MEAARAEYISMLREEFFDIHGFSMPDSDNDKIMDALWEDFLELYKVSDSFEKICDAACWDLFEEWNLEALFDKLVSNDLELFLHDKRGAVEALVLFKTKMAEFDELASK